MQKTSKRYIVVTPCKNEGENLPNLIQSIVGQTVRPSLWVIVDDGSTDETPTIIKAAAGKYKWILNIRLDHNKRDIGLHLARVMKKGFDLANKYCMKNNIDYSYLGNVDGDITLEHTFFENLIREFERDPKLGIASGTTKHIVGDKIIYAKMRIDEPSGGHMVIRRECFEQCGGIPISYGCDGVLKAKARLRGWKTRRFEENIATEIRDSNTAEGYWKGFFYQGKTSYYINLNPLHVLFRMAKYSLNGPYYAGIAYLLGYLSDFFNGSNKIDDAEIRTYFWNKFKEYL